MLAGSRPRVTEPLLSALHAAWGPEPQQQCRVGMWPLPVSCGDGGAVSGRQQHKVIVDVDHGNVEGWYLVDTQRLVPSRVQLLYLELPLHSLHSIKSCGFVLLPHEQAGLQRQHRGRMITCGVGTPCASIISPH